MKEFMAKQRNRPNCNFLKLPEGDQNVIFVKIFEKGNERLDLEGLNSNYQKLRGLEKEGQSEKTKSGGGKSAKTRNFSHGFQPSHARLLTGHLEHWDCMSNGRGRPRSDHEPSLGTGVVGFSRNLTKKFDRFGRNPAT